MADCEQVKANKDNKSNQCNSNHPEYKGHVTGYPGTGDKADLDNHATQMNSESTVHLETKEKGTGDEADLDKPANQMDSISTVHQEPQQK